MQEISELLLGDQLEQRGLEGVASEVIVELHARRAETKLAAGVFIITRSSSPTSTQRGIRRGVLATRLRTRRLPVHVAVSIFAFPVFFYGVSNGTAAIGQDDPTSH